MRDYEAEYKKLSNEMLVEELHNEAYMAGSLGDGMVKRIRITRIGFIKRELLRRLAVKGE